MPQKCYTDKLYKSCCFRGKCKLVRKNALPGNIPVIMPY